MTRESADVGIEIRPVLRRVRPKETEAYLAAYFESEVLPLVTPIALDRGHPLPKLREGARGVLVRFRDAPSRKYGVVLVHPALPSIVEAPGSERVPLDHVVATQVASLFDEPIDGCWAFRLVDRSACAAAGAQAEPVCFLADALERTRRKNEKNLPCAA